jgi:hypothetical protein
MNGDEWRDFFGIQHAGAGLQQRLTLEAEINQAARNGLSVGTVEEMIKLRASKLIEDQGGFRSKVVEVASLILGRMEAHYRAEEIPPDTLEGYRWEHVKSTAPPFYLDPNGRPVRFFESLEEASRRLAEACVAAARVAVDLTAGLAPEGEG